jgi:2-dehydro-3-deoxygluconokinase
MTEFAAFGETMLRLSPPGAERIETTDTLEFRTAGAESNAAIAAARMGADATWISKLPTGVLGDRVVRDLHGYGIDTEAVRSDEGRQGTYYLEQAGEPRGVNVVYDRSNAAVTTMTVDELPLQTIAAADVLFTTGITPALSSILRETTERLLADAADADIKRALDFNYRSKLWSPGEAEDVLTGLFPDVDVLIAAQRDAKEVLGLSGSATEITHSLASQYDFETVVLTRGDRGAVAWHDSVIHEQPAYETETTDPIGTGDAFAGAFLGRRIEGDDVPTALEYAAAAASIKRTIPGDVLTATRDEIETVIEGDTETISR